jgi:hypothetical protein
MSDIKPDLADFVFTGNRSIDIAKLKARGVDPVKAGEMSENWDKYNSVRESLKQVPK